MAAPLQLKRGLRANLPAKAALGEPLIATDTKELFIGQGTGAGDSEVYKVSDVIFAPSPQPVIVNKIWVNTTEDSVYRASDDGLEWLPIGGTGSSTVTNDITVYGVTQGTYSDGAVIPAGTSLEDVVKNMLQTIIPPTYLSPTLTITGSGSTTVEIGTTISPTLTPTFNQRDGGSPILYSLKKNGTDIYTGPTAVPYTEAGYVIDSVVSYQATESYDAGPIKNDNQGNPYPTGSIQAGTATSNTISYAGRRKLFYTIDTATTTPTTSADVRALPNGSLNPAAGTAFTMNIPAGTTRLSIAYPATIRDISSIKYVELGNGEVKDTFNMTLVNVEGAAGYAAIQYKVFTYLPAVPFSDAVTYQVVI